MIASPTHYCKLVALGFCLLSTAAAISAQDAAAPGESSKLTDEAYQQFEAGQIALALQGFSRALESDSGNLSARLGQAMAYLKQQRHKDAFEAYDQIVQRYPAHLFAWNGRGLAAFNLGNFDDALNSFQQATADQPVNGFFYESLAWAHFCRGDYALATSSAKQATLMYHQNGETASYPLLIAYFSQLEDGKPEAARRTLNYALNNKLAKEAWPSPVFDYAAGHLNATALISHVTNIAQETEAHTYIGLHLRSEGKPEKAQAHLDWVVAKGDSSVFEQTLARTLHIPEKVALLAP